MRRDEDSERKDIMDELAEDIRQEGDTQEEEMEEDENQIPSGFSPLGWAVIIGAGIVVLIIIFALFFGGGGDKTSTENLAPIKMKLDLLEKRLAKIEVNEQNRDRLEGRINSLHESISRLDKLAQRVDQLEKQKATVPSKTKTPTPVEKKSEITSKTKPSPSVEKKPVSKATSRTHEVKQGETLYQIAKKYGTSISELRRLNNLKQDQAIHPGQKILVP
ncbi:MAG: LysM peptidoglycan-binding domain-containing protein [Pseudomonadota bacterium]